ncbi:PiggyBac transposable element-derived protein 3 [Elysia marginata]|uniref:PiggyBac transposable element-derived protein 3 n=1 Tax=Elysia marginata TaxID=1093978 RepID=A0AAV4K160_9GAST|nr:PiggyBac transposable element-derived protein 3 [Elysia marginata]
MAANNNQEKRHGPQRLFSLHEAITLVEQYDTVVSADIFMQPLGQGQESDCDSGDEDSMNVNNLPRAQLQAQVDMTAQCTDGTDITLSQEKVDDDDKTAGPAAKKRKVELLETMWRKEDLQASPIKTAVWSAKEP